MKSQNAGNAQTGTVLAGRSAMSAMARKVARPVLGLGHGRPYEHGLTAETERHSMARADGNRRTAR